MVQQSSPQAPQQSQENSPGDFEIIDETSPEQVAVEQQVLAGRPITESLPVSDLEPVTEPIGEPASVETPAPVSPAQATPSAPQAPTQPIRTYSQEEYSRAQAAWERQITEARKQSEAAQQKIAQFDLSTSVETQLRAQEMNLEPTEGEDEARRIVRTPENQQEVRSGIEAKQQVAQYQAAFAVQEVQQEQQAKYQVIDGFARQYKLSQDDTKVLLAINDPYAMEAAASRLGSGGAPMVPRENSQTQLESGVSSASAPESSDALIERLNNTPAWDWTESDERFMRTGRR